MRILYVSCIYEVVQRNIVEMFIKKGETIDLFLYRIRYRQEVKNFPDYITYYCSSLNFRGPIFLLSRLKNVAKYYDKHIKKNKLDIIHGNMAFLDGYICRYLSIKYNIPYVITVRDTDMNSKYFWKLPWLKKELINNLLGAKKIIFLSVSYRDKLIDRLPSKHKENIRKKSVIIPNGIDEIFLENRYFRKNTPQSLRLIYIGKIGPRKNLELTVEAVKILKSKGVNVSLDVIGKVENKYYSKLIEENNFINYHKSCDKKQILTHLREADIFVMVSHTETFGLVYAEAMSQGLPVLYTREQGFDKQFEEGLVGYSVSDTDSIELAKKIEEVCNNYVIISQNCTKLSIKFSWHVINDQLREVYI